MGRDEFYQALPQEDEQLRREWESGAYVAPRPLTAAEVARMFEAVDRAALLKAEREDF